MILKPMFIAALRRTIHHSRVILGLPWSFSKTGCTAVSHAFGGTPHLKAKLIILANGKNMSSSRTNVFQCP